MFVLWFNERKGKDVWGLLVYIDFSLGLVVIRGR